MHPITLMLLVGPFLIALAVLGFLVWCRLFQRVCRNRPLLPAVILIAVSIIGGLVWNGIDSAGIWIPAVLSLAATGLFRITIYPLFKVLLIS
jgi:hypothetical protein